MSSPKSWGVAQSAKRRRLLLEETAATGAAWLAAWVGLAALSALVNWSRPEGWEQRWGAWASLVYGPGFWAQLTAGALSALLLAMSFTPDPDPHASALILDKSPGLPEKGFLMIATGVIALTALGRFALGEPGQVSGWVRVAEALCLGADALGTLLLLWFFGAAPYAAWREASLRALEMDEAELSSIEREVMTRATAGQGRRSGARRL